MKQSTKGRFFDLGAPVRRRAVAAKAGGRRRALSESRVHMPHLQNRPPDIGE